MLLIFMLLGGGKINQRADASAKFRRKRKRAKYSPKNLQISGIMPIFATSEQMFWLSG